MTATATVTGSPRDPALTLTFPPSGRHPAGPQMITWVKTLPSARFDPSTATWTVTGTGPNPQRLLTDAGFEIVGLGEGEFGEVTSLDQLVAPVSLLSGDARTVLIRHRLAGYQACLEMVGPGAVWDKARRLFKLPVSDVLTAGQPRSGVVWDPAAVERAYKVHATTPLIPGLETAAAALGTATDRTLVEDQVRRVAARVGHYPDWWGLPPMAHQVPGALAVAAGHTLLADEPGVGKTVTVLLAAGVLGVKRLFVVCPPLVVTHWAREIERTGLSAADNIVAVQAGKKHAPFDTANVIIVPDSLLASRPALADQVVEWGPGMMVADEAHRFKTAGSKRTEAILSVKARVPEAVGVAITGTPVLSGPHELVPLLEFTGHLPAVFGGAGAFLTRFCRQDSYGGWHPNKRTQSELHRKLVEHVWVRRTKAQVLPNLPEVAVDRLPFTVDLTEYRKTHQDILDRVDQWLAGVVENTGRNPTPFEIDAYIDTAIQFASWLRRAAGLTKITAVTELVRDHVKETGTGAESRPMLVWAHHHDVIAALRDKLGAPSIDGGTNRQEADRLIDGFQAGQVPVLICSITAVGAGVTLTRGSDAVFAEMDWTPAMMQQAVDRQRRIGQNSAITVRIPIAQGTLDEHIARVLTDKALTVGAITGDTSAEMFATTDKGEMTPAKLVKEMVLARILERTGGQTAKAA